MKTTITDPAEIFAAGFPTHIRDTIIFEARKHLAPLATEVARQTFAQLPCELKTPGNKEAMEKAAKETVALKTTPEETIRILRAWVVKLEIDDEVAGKTKVSIAYRKS